MAFPTFFNLSLNLAIRRPVYIITYGASLMAQMVKNPPTMQEIQVPFLGQKDPQEKGKATHSGILSWREFHGQRSQAGYSPWSRRELGTWTEEPGRPQSEGSHRVGHD